MKKRNSIRIMALAAAVLILAMALTACKPPKKTLTEDQKADISAELTQYAERMGISASVYAVYRGEELLDFSQGDFSGKGSGILYGVASLTKQITAASIMKLYDEGRLDIEDKLSKYFPDYRYGDSISLRQLLCQRSGIPDYSVDSYDDAVWVSCDGSYDTVEIKADNTAEKNRKIIKDFFMSCELLFEPGERFNYSDSNYALLAEITEQVSGMSYHEYVRKNIFEPLGMDTASFIDDHGDGGEIAPADGSEFDYDYFDYKGAEFGCGDMLASAADLYKWYRGFTGGEVVSDSSYALMTENYSEEGALGYGFGLMISDEVDTKTVYHYGWIPSYYSSVFMIPEYDLFVAVLADSSRGYPQSTAAKLTERLSEFVGLEIKGIE